MASANSQMCDAAIGRLEKKMQEMKNSLRKENNYLYKVHVKKMETIIKMLDNKKKKSKQNNLTLIIVVSLVALGVGGYLIYKYHKGKGGTGSIKSVTASSSVSSSSK